MNTEPNTILIVDDDAKILFAFREVFRKDGFKCLTASNGEDAVAQVVAGAPDLVFMDITMPKLDGLAALKAMKTTNPMLPVILITGFGTMQTAVRAIQQGAFDYLTKPLDVDRIRAVTKKALDSIRATPVGTSEVRSFDEAAMGRSDLIGKSPAMQEVYKLIGSISLTPNHTSVLILGESGTGKELVARAIHANGANAQEPFIPINCTAFPETLLEAELFGHERGAFTGAGERRLGKFEYARKGTIFLDEIGTLSLHLQQKLLRALQEREFERLGDNVPIKIEARFIAATNQDLATEVKKKMFREDLYFRLNVAPVRLPPLRERREDIPLLAEYFLLKYSKQLNRPIKGFSAETVAMLQSAQYPGNVRELENVIERAVMLTTGEVVLPHALEDVHTRLPGEQLDGSKPDMTFGEARIQAIAQFEKEFLLRKLEQFHGNIALAAEASRMTRQNFQRLVTKYGLSPKDYRK